MFVALQSFTGESSFSESEELHDIIDTLPLEGGGGGSASIQNVVWRYGVNVSSACDVPAAAAANSKRLLWVTPFALRTVAKRCTTVWVCMCTVAILGNMGKAQWKIPWCDWVGPVIWFCGHVGFPVGRGRVKHTLFLWLLLMANWYVKVYVTEEHIGRGVVSDRYGL